MSRVFLLAVEDLLLRLTLALHDPRPRTRMVEVGIGLLCGEHPKTITSALEFNGPFEKDWSAAYRLFSQTGWAVEDIFRQVLHAAMEVDSGPVFSAQDDTLVRKTGKCMPGTAYARDPLSPPFRVNLVRGQRFLQTAVMIQPGEDSHPWRAVPVSFQHAPVLKPPPRASEDERKAVKEARKKQTISLMARRELARLRTEIDATPGGFRRLLINTGDGSFANRTYLSDVPERTTVVVRVRKNARLRQALPAEYVGKIRKYGKPLPTPEQMLSDESIPLVTRFISSGGRIHMLRYKIVEDARWPKATGTTPVRLILIKPLGYRLRKGGKLLYRQPAFLLAVGEPADVETLIRAYLARWEIEVSFRDEKSILGVGKAQVWNELSIQRAPAFHVACYSCLLLASIRCFADRRTDDFAPLSPWRNDDVIRPSARDLVRLLRHGLALRRQEADAPAAAA